jgi:hypothetical protein
MLVPLGSLDIGATIGIGTLNKILWPLGPLLADSAGEGLLRRDRHSGGHNLR